MSQSALLNEVNANLKKMIRKQEEIEQEVEGLKSGLIGQEDIEARKRETKALVEETVAKQYEARMQYASPQFGVGVDPNTGNPLPALERQLSFRGGMFGKFGQNPVSYQNLIGGMHERNKWVKSKNGHEIDLFLELQDSHDAFVLLRDHVWRKYKDATEDKKYRALSDHPDFKRHVNNLIWAGYLHPDNANRKANEIMNPGDTGRGLDALDYTFLSGNLLMFVELEADLAPSFFNFTLPRAAFTINIQTNHARGFLGGTSGTVPPITTQSTNVMPHANLALFSQLQFNLISFLARYNMVILPFNDQMEEDSIIPWLPKMRQELAQGLVESTEDALLNGDTSATHMDTDTQALGANAYQKAFAGLRKMSLANVSHDFNGATTVADLDAMIDLMGKYGTRPGQQAFVVGASQVHDIRNLQELSEFQTWGANNTYPTGVIGEYRGRQIRTHKFVREDTDATGVNGATGNTKAVCYLVRFDRFWLGRMRAAMSENFRLPTALVTYLVTNIREDFRAIDIHEQTTPPVFDGPTGPVVTGFNITI